MGITFSPKFSKERVRKNNEYLKGLKGFLSYIFAWRLIIFLVKKDFGGSTSKIKYNLRGSTSKC